MNTSISSQANAFTIVEILTTLVILAILVAVAGPAYRKHVARTEILEAKNILEGVKLKVEQYYHENQTMPVNLAALSLVNTEFDHVPIITDFQIYNTGCASAVPYNGTWCMVVFLDKNKTQTSQDGALIYSTTIASNKKVNWTCTTDGSSYPRGIPSKLMPNGCVVP